MSRSCIDVLWDVACCATVVGIWPRFIEPRLISLTHLRAPLHRLPPALQGLTIVQFSDLHLHPEVPDHFLDKMVTKIQALQPDMIVFTGDFLCYGELTHSKRLAAILQALKAPYGCYAIFGNHDYAQAVTINSAGDYDILEHKPSALLKGLKRLAENGQTTGRITERAKAVKMHSELVALLQETPFRLLHNQSICIPVKGEAINVCGLGEYMLGRCLPDVAFQGYDRRYPGIILTHNPDSLSKLKEYPGELYLSGHTHGGQVNLPWIWKKYTLMENRDFARGGRFELGDGRWLYVSRGIGSVLPFRANSLPEIVHLTLEAAP